MQAIRLRAKKTITKKSRPITNLHQTTENHTVRPTVIENYDQTSRLSPSSPGFTNQQLPNDQPLRQNSAKVRIPSQSGGTCKVSSSEARLIVSRDAALKLQCSNCCSKQQYNAENSVRQVRYHHKVSYTDYSSNPIFFS